MEPTRISQEQLDAMANTLATEMHQRGYGRVDPEYCPDTQQWAVQWGEERHQTLSGSYYDILSAIRTRGRIAEMAVGAHVARLLRRHV